MEHTRLLCLYLSERLFVFFLKGFELGLEGSQFLRGDILEVCLIGNEKCGLACIYQCREDAWKDERG